MAAGKSMPKELIYLVVAVLCGAFAVWQVRQHVEGKIATYRQQLTNTVKVLKVTRNLGLGERISENDLEPVDVPKAFKFDKRAVKFEDKNKVINRPVGSPVEAGELLLWYAIDVGATASISEKIPEGMKAITIPVTRVTGVDGLLRPNMAVDLYGTFRIPADTPGRARKSVVLNAVKLLENVTIIATGEKSSLDSSLLETIGVPRNDAKYATITVLVKTQDVERMILALELAERGGTKLYCVLRSEMDTKPAGETQPVTEREFITSLKQRASGVKD